MKLIKKRLLAYWKKSVLFTAGLVFLATAQNGFAGMLGATTLSISATLVDACVVESIAGKNFGTYPSLGAGDVTDEPAGSISIRCSSGLSYRILFNSGQNPISVFRQMRRGASADLIRYSLKRADTNVIVGDKNPISGYGYIVTMPFFVGITGVGDDNPDDYSLSADLFFSASSHVGGTYTDSVSVTIHW